MRHFKSILTYGIPLILFAQFGRESDTNKAKPAINFYGTITDNSGRTFSAENITVNNSYKDIPLYLKPQNPQQDPLKNMAQVNLQEIQEIRPVFDQEKPRIITFNSRNYIEIIVVRKCEPPVEDSYVIEATRKLIFDETQHGCPIRRELSFEALKKLTLTGHEARDTESTKEEKKERESKKELQCAQAGKALGELSEKAEQLPTSEKGTFSQLIDKVKDLVGSICSAS